MASPWIPPQRHPAERPWMGMAMLAAIPLLSLILIRLLWSGSSLWFLTVGLILLGAAGVIFLARRPQEHVYGRQTLAQETNRLPLALTALGILFLAMLLLPNFSSGDGSVSDRIAQQFQQQAPGGAAADVADTVEPAAQPTAVDQQTEPAAEEPAATAGQTYVIVAGDTLWDIAQRFGTSVDAIVEANGLANPADIAVDQELVIPPPGAEVQAAQLDPAGTSSEEATPPAGEALPEGAGLDDVAQ